MSPYPKGGKREIILERKQAIILFTGGIIALILIFILGMLFGRNLASRKYAGEQAKVAKEAYFPKKSPPAKPAPAEKKSEKEKEEVLKKIEEQKPPSELLAKPSKSEEQKAKTEESKQIEEVIEKAEQTSEEKKESSAEKKPQEKPAEKPEAIYTIQVASFPEKASAEELVKKLKEKKWQAYMESAEIPGKGTYWRVYVGKYSNKEQADKALVIFKSREPDFKDAFVKKRG